MDLQAIIFDIDGTVADTEADGHRVAFNLAFGEAGLDWDWDRELYGRLLDVTGGRERIAHYAAHCAPSLASAPDFPAFAALLHQRKCVWYRRLLAEGRIPLRGGVAALIDAAAAAGLRLAIATTSATGNVEALLDRLLPRWRQQFGVCGFGETVVHKKPAPDIYRWVLAQLDLPPAACLAIEDSHNGLRAAGAAGIPVLVTPAPYTRDQDFAGALAVFAGLGDGPGRIDLPALRRLHANASVAVMH
jgi:HAD superfamily hydrolase (TIGR01509 family)